MRRLYFFILAISLQLAAYSASATQLLLLVGGGKRPPAAIREFAKAAGQQNGRILFIAWATAYPNESLRSLTDDFLPHYQGQMDHSAEAPSTRSEQEKFLHKLSKASAVFFSGGNQLRIAAALQNAGGENLKAAMKSAYSNGIPFGGTSAGTAIMSEMTIADYPDSDGKVPLVSGLGLLPENFIVDQHFSQRPGRLQRLLKAQVQLLLPFALGVDEDTAVLLRNHQHAEVFGENGIHLFHRNSSGSLQRRSFRRNDNFTIPGYCVELLATAQPL